MKILGTAIVFMLSLIVGFLLSLPLGLAIQWLQVTVGGYGASDYRLLYPWLIGVPIISVAFALIATWLWARYSRHQKTR